MAHLTATGRAYRLKRYTRPALNPSGGAPSLTAPTAGKIAGVVKEGATPVPAAHVSLYYRPNKRLIATQRTNQWGGFLFTGLDQTLGDNYFVVAFDPDGGTQYNALVYDRLTAVTSLTRPVVSNGFEGSLFGISSMTFGDYAGYIKGLTPLAYWRLKETSGTTFADEMGFAPLTSHGTFSLNQPPALFDADGASITYNMANTTDYLGTGKITGLVGGAAGFSIVAHVKLGNGAGGMTMLSWRNYTPGGGDYIYGVMTHDRNVVDDFSYESWSWSTPSTRPYALGVSDDRWHMTVLTYTAADNTMRLYIDGYLVDTKVQGTPPVYPNNASMTLFNNVDGLNPQSVNCSLSEVAVFDRPLTATQVMLAATLWAQNAKLNANDKAPGITLSNGDLTATGTNAPSNWHSVRATHRKTTGRWYWETEVSSAPSGQGVMVGIAPYSMDLLDPSHPVGLVANSGGLLAEGAGTSKYYANGALFRGSLPNIPVGAVIGHVYDVEMTTHDIYLNGVFVTSRYGFTAPHYPAISAYGGGSATVRFSGFTYTPPEYCQPFAAAEFVAPATIGWSPTNKSTYWKLSAATHIAGYTAVNWGTILGTLAKNVGQRYFEITVVIHGTAAGSMCLGVADITHPLSYAVGNGAYGWGYTSNQYKYNSDYLQSYGAVYTAGDVIGVAVDFTAGSIEFFKNGTSQGVAYATGVTGSLFPAASAASDGNRVSLNVGDRAFAYTPPSGFVAWNN